MPEVSSTKCNVASCPRFKVPECNCELGRNPSSCCHYLFHNKEKTSKDGNTGPGTSK
jgi:hypothetical protein